MCIKHAKSPYLSSWWSRLLPKYHDRNMTPLLVLEIHVRKVIDLRRHICRDLWFDQVLSIKKILIKIDAYSTMPRYFIQHYWFWNKTCIKINDRPRSTYIQSEYTVCVWPFSPQTNNNNTSTLGADSENVHTHAFHDNFHSFGGHEETMLSHAIHW